MSERSEDLENRYKLLKDHRAACDELNIRNPDLHFKNKILNEQDHGEAENLMAELEATDMSQQVEVEKTKWLVNRKSEYKKIDNLLLEALYEKEQGDNARWNEYVALRDSIKFRFPK